MVCEVGVLGMLRWDWMLDSDDEELLLLLKIESSKDATNY